MSLFVIDPGWATRVVDGGRPHSRSLSVPVGGAADRVSWMLGNALVGNPPETAALEIALKGPVLRTDAEVAGVVFGAPFELHSARQSFRAGRTFTLAPSEELHIGGTPSGLRAYLCVPGGFQTSAILGSQSALDAIRRGVDLACTASRLRARFAGPECPFLMKPTAWWALRVLPGQQANWFDSAAEFQRQVFTATPASDRMGLRLQGFPLPLPDRELISQPVCPGAVQVTKDGQCIILGIDGQTIGGYPKIAHVIRADLDALGQIRPGDMVCFQKIDLPEARQANQERQTALQEWITRMRVSLAG